MEVVVQKYGAHHPNTANVFNGMGIFFGDMGEVEKEMEYHQKALTIRQTALGEEHPETAASYINLGYCYGEKGDYEQQLNYYKKGLLIQRQVYGEQHWDVAISYNNIGWCHRLKGDYDEALLFYEKALSIRQALMNDQDHDLIASSYSNIGMALGHKKDYAKAAIFFKKSLDMLRRLFQKEEHPGIAQGLDNMASCLEKSGNIAEAIRLYEQALHIREQLFKNSHQSHGISYLQLGSCCILEHDYAKAMGHFEAALTINSELFGLKNPYTAQCFLKIADCLVAMNEPQQAIGFYHRAMNSLLLDYDQESVHDTPSLGSYSSPLLLLDALKGKAEAMYAAFNQHKSDESWLHVVYETYHLCVQLVNEIILSYKAEGSKLLLTNKVMPILEQAIQVALRSYEHTGLEAYLEQVYLFVEQSKSIVLLSYLRDANARVSANIPTELLDKERELRTDISYYQQKISTEKAKGAAADSEKIRRWNDRLFTHKGGYDELVQQFETAYPAYYELKYNLQSASLAAIRQTLTEHQALVEYFFYQELLFIIVITREGYHIQQFYQPDLPNYIHDFNKYVNQVRRKPFIKTAHQLYQILVAPCLPFLKNKKQWIIIPGGELYLLPFGALVTDMVDKKTAFTDLPYLIQQFDLIYHYSATLWLHEAQKKRKKTNKQPTFVGFAPVYKERSVTEVAQYQANMAGQMVAHRSAVCQAHSFRELPHTQLEVNNIVQLFLKKSCPAHAFIEQAATKQNFTYHAEHCDYLLIAAHGLHNKVHKQQSGIIFSPDRDKWTSYEHELFYISEAYNLDLRAGLVVLSSCESGIGNLVKGEGMMAINRGFLYSGAANIIFTIYKIFDQSSGELSRMLFEHILAGKSYSEALRAAQLSLIAQKETNPKSWAGFVLIGIGA